MNVYEEAHGLAKAIRESEEYKQYNELKTKLEADPTKAAMIHDYEKKQMEIQAKSVLGEVSMQEAQQQLAGTLTFLQSDPLAMQYMQAQMRFNVMMADVYKILGDAMGLGNLM